MIRFGSGTTTGWSSNGRQDRHYGSYIGGTSSSVQDGVFAGVVLDDHANATLCGRTGAATFPTVRPFQAGFGGVTDAVVVQLDMLPTGADRYGTSTPACGYPIYAGVNRWPRRNTGAFKLLGTGAPPTAPGVLLFGFPSAPYPVLNIQVLVSPIAVAVSGATTTANGLGYAEFNLPVPSTAPVGAQFGVQWVFLTTAGCPGSGPLSASDGMRLTIQ